MSAIFISYRRDDQPGVAGRLADALVSAFGADSVFRDIEDIQPGEDFAVTIQSQLGAVGVMLVLIGPAWLTAHRSSVRRIDEPGDFVRLEIEAGLQSGKPVLPVLIGGASMPSENDLPPSIGGLARRQAFILSDQNWAVDVARVAEFIGPRVPPRRRRLLRRGVAWGLAGVGLVALLVFGLKVGPPGSSSAVSRLTSPEIEDQLSGRWTAQVKYDWGVVHEEIFAFRVENGEVHGTASYLRVARTVEQGKLLAGQVNFLTHSQEVLGEGPVRDVTHRYRGGVKADELLLVLETSGGHSTHPPVEFVARRVSR